MMRYGTGFALDHIFVTHLHADHYLGIIGLVRTMGLQGRTDPLHIHGPVGSETTLSEAVRVGGHRIPFSVEFHEIAAGEGVGFGEFRIEAFPVRHGVASLGFALRESERPGRFDVDRARELGVPEGPLFGKIHRGEVVEVEGRHIRPSEIVGAPRPGRLVVYSGDTRPAPELVEAATGADLLIHDATFTDEEMLRARETFHSTAREAAEVGLAAGVRRLYLTHVSARYSANTSPLEKEAREIFAGTEVAYDGLVLEVGFPGEGEGS
jgi:ribonuclease Z